MKLLLDTHIWIWLLEAPEKLSTQAREAIQEERRELLGVSDISCWEVARKESLGKLSLTMSSRHWLARACRTDGLRMLRIDSEISWESCHLPGSFHRDPADQIIVATARVGGLTLVTCDERILAYPGVRTLW